MTTTFAGSLSRKALAASLAAALTFTPAGVAPARADGNGDAIAAAAFFGLVAALVIASTRDGRAYSTHPPVVTPRIRVPSECRFDIRRGVDRGTWYGRRCMVEHGVSVWSLPDRCKQRVELPRRHYDVIAYSAQCLARIGSGPVDRGRDHGHGDRH